MNKLVLEYMNAFDRCAEWLQGQTCDLEELFSEWNADDRHAENQSDEEIDQRKQDAAEDKPQNVQQERNTAAVMIHFFAERIQRNAGKFEALYADRNADNCHTPSGTDQKPSDCTDQAAEDDP